MEAWLTLGHAPLNSQRCCPTAVPSLVEQLPCISTSTARIGLKFHDTVIKWKHFPRCWPFVRGIQWSPVNSPHKGQWCRTLMFSLICGRINSWVNNGEAGELRRHRAHYDVIIMWWENPQRDSPCLPGPTSLDQSVHPCSYPFRQKGVFFNGKRRFSKSRKRG